MSNLKQRIATHLITAQKDEDDVQNLRILVDEPSHRLMNKLYKQYISADDFSKFHAFTIDMDRLLARFGGQPPKVMQQPTNNQQPVPGNQEQPNPDEQQDEDK